MTDKIVVLTGGVGGAKFVRGLTAVLPPENITAIVNTADDFEHLGLRISPDIDSLVYALADQSNPELGWGRKGESWAFMDALKGMGGPDWFLLGDLDLAMHVLRTHGLNAGATLAEMTARLAGALGVGATILPMSNDPVATFLDTDEGELPFQRYFVERRCQPVVHQVRFEGAAHASALPAAIEAICDPATSAIMIAPSNPWLSVDPLLSVPGMREALRSASAPIVAISPIVGGQAVKGPTTKLMAELGLSISNETIADHYADFLDAMLVDVRDGMPIVPVACAMANTLMQSLEDRARVARAALDLAAGLDR